MRTNWEHLEQFRKNDGPYGSLEGEHDGFFFIKRGSYTIAAMASQGGEEIPWEHVSIRVCAHKGDRIPTWEEMCFVKQLFWGAEECVVQYHPPESDYVNCHPCVLHLWKPIGIEMPRPPSICVGFK